MRLFIRKLYLCILVLLHSRMLLLSYQNDRSNYLHVFPCLRLSFPFILLEVIACIRLLKLLNKDTYQQFKAHQEQDREESYALIFCFFSTERIVINAKMHRQKMLQTRIPALENLYKTKLN